MTKITILFFSIVFFPVRLLLVLLSVPILILGNVTKNEDLKRYAHNRMLAEDQAWNADAGGDPDEGVSGRLGRGIGKDEIWFAGPLREFVDGMAFLLVGEVDHCKNAVEAEESHDKELIKWFKSRDG